MSLGDIYVRTDVPVKSGFLRRTTSSLQDKKTYRENVAKYICTPARTEPTTSSRERPKAALRHPLTWPALHELNEKTTTPNQQWRQSSSDLPLPTLPTTQIRSIISILLLTNCFWIIHTHTAVRLATQTTVCLANIIKTSLSETLSTLEFSAATMQSES
jgi:hypothetical protein